MRQFQTIFPKAFEVLVEARPLFADARLIARSSVSGLKVSEIQVFRADLVALRDRINAFLEEAD